MPGRAVGRGVRLTPLEAARSPRARRVTLPAPFTHELAQAVLLSPGRGKATDSNAGAKAAPARHQSAFSIHCQKTKWTSPD